MFFEGNTIYNFTYTGNALFGKLFSITDQSKKQLIIKRDFHGRVESIQTPNNYLIKVDTLENLIFISYIKSYFVLYGFFKLKLNNFDMLRSVTTPDNQTTNFNYLSNTGLLTSKIESNGQTTVFNYEKNGRIKEVKQ